MNFHALHSSLQHGHRAGEQCPTEARHGHHPSGSWSGGRAISCDMAGRSGLLCTRTRNLQIESLVCDCLEDDPCFGLSKVAQRHLLQEVIRDSDLQLELVAFAHDTTEGEGLEGELALLHRDVEGLLYAVNDRDEGSLFPPRS